MINMLSTDIEFANKELFDLVNTPKEEEGLQRDKSYKALKQRLSLFFSSHAFTP
jgi:hypothetical protein